MKKIVSLIITLGILVGPQLRAQELEAEIQAKVTAKVAQIETWAADAGLVKAVKAHNESPAADLAALNQENWKALGILDPIVRNLTKNDAANVIKAKKSESVSEAFLSGADGTKVAFLTKPSNWSHKGKDKHEVPMSGKTWQGPVEVDDSTGVRQIQVAVPVRDGDKVIGSLVVGLDLTKLKAE